MPMLFRPPKKEPTIKLELVATDLQFDNNNNNSSSSRGGRWCHPFVQITNAHGNVVARSKILLNCTTVAHWPVMHTSWRRLILSSSSSSSSWPPEEDDDHMDHHYISAASHALVLKQPLLLTIYDFKSSGNHVILARVKTSWQDLVDKADALATESVQVMQGKPASFTLDNNNNNSPVVGKLYVKQVQSTRRGKADALMETQFAAQEQEERHDDGDVTVHCRLRNLEHVPPPPGIHANDWEASTLSNQTNNTNDSQATNSLSNEGDEEGPGLNMNPTTATNSSNTNDKKPPTSQTVVPTSPTRAIQLYCHDNDESRSTEQKSSTIIHINVACHSCKEECTPPKPSSPVQDLLTIQQVASQSLDWKDKLVQDGSRGMLTSYSPERTQCLMQATRAQLQRLEERRRQAKNLDATTSTITAAGDEAAGPDKTLVQCLVTDNSELVRQVDQSEQFHQELKSKRAQQLSTFQGTLAPPGRKQVESI